MSDVLHRAMLSRLADQRVITTPTATNRFAALGSQTQRDFGLFDYTLAARSPGAAPHYHQTFSESFYLLDGELTILDNDTWITAGPGDLVYVPRNGIHGFRNDGDVPARFLIVFAPGAAREGYFEGLAEMRAAGIEMTPEVVDEFARKHDQFNVR